MITSIELHNLQIHEYLKINLKPGLNVIVGNTNSGKTAIIRGLNLLLRNKPRNGETAYKNKHTDRPLKITITDDGNNTIVRHKRKYILNGTELKAFGANGIPEPINEIIPLKDLNWQFQLDPHFLILQTGGQAAKTLNASTNMENQEILIKAFKDDISVSNTNVNRLIKNNQENQDTVDTLYAVPVLLEEALEIRKLEETYEENDENIQELIELIYRLEDCREVIASFNYIKKFQSEIYEIDELVSESLELKSKVNQLEKIIYSLEELSEINFNQETYSNMSVSLEEINELQEEYFVSLEKAEELSDMITSLEKIRVRIDDTNEQIKQNQDLYNKKLLENDYCPFCDSDLRDRKHKCK